MFSSDIFLCKYRIFMQNISSRDDLIDAQCSLKVKSIKAEITLRKKEARRWCALEAVNSKGKFQCNSFAYFEYTSPLGYLIMVDR